MEASSGGGGSRMFVRRVPASTETEAARVLDVLRYASSVQSPERWGKPPRTPRRVPLPRVRIDATRARFRGCGGPFRASDPSRRDHSGRERPSRGGRSSTAGGRAFRAAPGGRKAGSLTSDPTAWSGPGASLLRRQATRAPERTPGRARTFSECPRKRTSGSSAAEKVDPGGLARIHFGKGSWYGPVESSRDHRGTEEKSRSGVSPHSCRKLLCGQHLSASTIYVSHAPAHAP